MKQYEFEAVWMESVSDERLKLMGLHGWHVVGIWQHRISEFTVRTMAMMEREFTALDRIEVKGDEHERDTTGSGTTTEG